MNRLVGKYFIMRKIPMGESREEFAAFEVGELCIAKDKMALYQLEVAPKKRSMKLVEFRLNEAGISTLYQITKEEFVNIGQRAAEVGPRDAMREAFYSHIEYNDMGNSVILLPGRVHFSLTLNRVVYTPYIRDADIDGVGPTPEEVADIYADFKRTGPGKVEVKEAAKPDETDEEFGSFFGGDEPETEPEPPKEEPDDLFFV